MNTDRYIQHLSRKGRHFFTLDEAVETLGKSKSAVLAALARMQKKQVIAKPIQGFYLIVPPRYQLYACLPADQFIPDLMNYLKLPYYVGLLSAASYHDAAHQKPQQFQVVTNQYLRPLQCGQINVVFIENKNIGNVPIQRLNTPTGYITISTTEATAVDLVRYPLRSGGINNIATVLIELAEAMDPKRLRNAIKQIQPNSVTIQRLGYLLDLTENKILSDATAETMNFTNMRPRPLVSGISTAGAKRNNKWQLYINYDVEPDL